MSDWTNIFIYYFKPAESFIQLPPVVHGKLGTKYGCHKLIYNLHT